ncbi:hypothetical protein N7462_004666 [Penicillium macrosclerotiorum]|uniref:uncharacterized protein n=1 Tax=Penicillium macrosclerotiorum TaxID=303699 RepID=UPI00254851E8|nr:uncharacterized protein N7462_004666 [Penicillium macrosclerotiorum]KAJ5690274.1 hypothetical protein N7462_004666 [Penicillium macrosclerotiorum]
MGSNQQPYPRGIHVPCLTWFKADTAQSIDWELQERHLEFLVSSGLHGIVIAGTNGEAATLKPEEKSHLLRLTRSTAQKLGRADLPVTCGTFGGCTQAIIDDTKLVAEAGADYALVLVPSYFHFALDAAAIVGFFQEVATASPIPIIIYNFPGVAAGLNVNSEMLETLGEHPNIAAVKLTCGAIASVARTAAKFGRALEGRSSFVALAGQSDWLVPCLSVGGAGSVTGLANLYPKTLVELYNLHNAGKTAEAEKLQLQVAVSEWGFAKGGINGTKWVVAKSLGYAEESSWCRRPYPPFLDDEKRIWITKQVKSIEMIENRL